MGGKNAQRTKGNTRPSSSGRTALLLPENAVNNPFIGFSAFKEVNSGEQASFDSKTEEFDLSSDSDLCLVLKKMQKKDNVTKIKALQEFSELCDTKDEEVVKALLPLWPKFFNKLSLDIDWKVREAVHKAMKHLLRRVKREIAPFLKQLMPMWLLSFFDPYPPSASAAIASFNVAFPNSKQKEVFMFCRVEVISFCKENLLKIELNDVISPESEVDNKEFILLNSSLKVLSLLVVKLDTEISADFMKSLLETDKFWKFCNHKNPDIRASWFKLKSSVCDVLPDLLKQYSVKACRTTLNHITDSDPNVCSAIWENCSLIVQLIEDWWKHINLSNSFKPQLFCAMKKKSNSFIFPHLLVILKHLPKNAFANNFEFIQDFLNTFGESLQINSKFPSDFGAVVVAYFECIKYLSTITELLSDSEKSTILEYVLSKQVKHMLLKFISDYSVRKRNTVYYAELAKFVVSLNGLKQQTDVFQCIKDVCLIKTQDAFNNEGESLLGLTHFIQELAIEKPKSVRHVQFNDNYVNETIATVKIASDTGTKTLKTFEPILLLLVEQVLKAIETHSFDSRWLKFSYELSNIGECFSLLRSDQKKSIEAFLQNYLKDDSLKGTTANMQEERIELTINLLFKIFMVSESSKTESLNHLINFNEPLVLENVIKNMKLYTNDAFIVNWLRSETAVKYVLTIAKELVNRIHNKEDSMKLELNALWNSLTVICTLEPMNNAWLNEVILLFHETIRESNTRPSNDMIDFVCEVFEKIFFLYKPCYTLESMSSLLLTFFKLSCQQSGKRKKLFSAWSKGLEMMCKNSSIDTTQNLLTHLVVELHKLLNGNISSKEKAVIVTENIVEILTIVEKNSCSEGKTGKSISVDLILNTLLLSFEEWTQLISALNYDYLYPVWFSGTLIYRKEYVDNISGKQVAPAVFTAAVVINILNYSRPHVDSTKNIPHLCNQLFSYVVFGYCRQVSSFLAYKPGENIHEVYELLEQSYCQIITHYSNYVKDEVVPQLYQLSLTKGPLFGISLRYVLDVLQENEIPESCVPVSQNFNAESIATMQLISSHLKKEKLCDLYNSLLYQLLSSDSMYEINSGLGSLALMHSFLQLNIDVNFDEHVNPILEYLVGFKEQKPTLYSYRNDEAYLQFATVLTGIYECVVSRWSECITNNQKDLIFCSVTSWITNFCSDKDLLINTSLLIFAYRTLKLAKTITNTFKDPSTSLEWFNFHSKRINACLFPFFCTFKSDNLPHTHHFLCMLSDVLILSASNESSDIESLSQVIQEKPYHEEIIEDPKCLRFTIPVAERTLLSNLSPLMSSQERCICRTAHCLIMKILPSIASKLEIENVEEEDCYLTPPMFVLSTLHQTDQIVEAMLSDFRVGDCCCVVDATTDAYHFTVCYLLLWVQVLEYLAHLSAENRSLLSNYLTESRLFFKLMNNLFRLLPINEMNNDSIQALVMKPLGFDVNSVPSSLEVQHIACQLYLISLKTMPATVRLWMGSQDKRIVDAINDFTTVNVSQHMCAEEFQAIQSANLSTFKNMSIKSRPAAREIFAVYAIEDMSIELTITFPANHPISPVTIDGGKRVGVNSSQWRTWLLQLTTFLTHQNGSIVDGLLLWKKNIDKKFEGVEECMICFYILHGSTCQLPKLSCKHCKKKYHPACLFKWFKTSNNATCPLCRNLFDTKF